jgi:glyoxylase-like metal-dependent hydrolase (beta-lactamase superfamily II)
LTVRKPRITTGLRRKWLILLLDNVFCGDSLFHADIGSARCDFPGGSATELFKSGRKLLNLSEDVKIWPGHDYPPEQRAPTSWMTVKQHKEQNMHLREGMTEPEFVALREERDKTLAAPKLVHQSLQFNIRAGRLPDAMGPADFRLLHLPLKLDCVEW